MQTLNNQLVLTSTVYTTAASTTNDVVISSSKVVIVPHINEAIVTGLSGINTNGMFIEISNGHPSNILVLAHNSGSSSGNRFNMVSGNNLYLSPGEAAFGSYYNGFFNLYQNSEKVFIEVGKTANQSIPNNSLTLVTWDSEIIKRGISHSNSSNSSRLIIPTNGSYISTIRISYATWSAGFNNRCQIQVYKNGSLYKEIIDVQLASAASPSISVPFTIQNGVAGDYYEVHVLQENGSTRDIDYTQTSWFLHKIA